MSDFEVPERFWSKVDVGEADECWEWLACRSGAGYGQFSINHKNWYAHRVAWILTFGKIPGGLDCCHKYDNPSCCNPYHLFLGTHQDNMVDSAKKGLLGKKLTKEDVLEIRELYTEGGWTQQELAEAFDVSQPTIYSIVKRKWWAWLESKRVSDGHAS